MASKLPDDPGVRAVSEAQPPALRNALLDLRGHILAATAEVGRTRLSAGEAWGRNDGAD